MKKKQWGVLFLIIAIAAGMFLTGCGNKDTKADGKTVIEMVQYKPEAVNVFEKFEKEFNKTHNDIYLKIDSPNDAMTILKTRFIREDNPDIIGIGGDINYSNFLDAEMLMDISDFDGLANIKEKYLQTNKDLEYVPMEGVYAVPYMANAAGILFNRDMFKEHKWKIPTTWDELIALCEQIKSEGILPMYFGFKDSWTTLAPWNAIAVDLCEPDLTYQVNSGQTKFSEHYAEVAEKEKALLPYAQKNPVAQSYNDACTAFARGESAMYVIGNYAIPQIRSVNPDMNIGSFVFPASNDAEKNILNSGNDLMFCVMNTCENKEAAYEVLRYMLSDESISKYLDDQSAVPCKEGDFPIVPELEEMRHYIENGLIADYQDHHYPSEMAVDALIQTYLLDNSQNATDKFMKKFDKEWIRYNKDIIAKVQEYEEGK